MLNVFKKHRKWLIVTMWVASISFIAAGFVGWGSYNLTRSSSTVAIVGDREISFEEYQREYSNLYQQYASSFGAQFNEEIAKQLNLEGVAFNLVVQRNLLLNYADELGFKVLNDDIARELVAVEAFQKDGKFDKELYIQVLAQNQTDTTRFEAGVARDLLIQKVENIFTVDKVGTELDDTSKLFFTEDDLNISVIDAKNIKIDFNEDALKNYWKTNTNNYMSPTSFDVEKEFVPLITRDIKDDELEEYYSKNKVEFIKEDGIVKTFEEVKDDIKRAIFLQESKKEALRKYIDLKKDDSSFTQKENITENSTNYKDEDLKLIFDAKANEILKPIEQKDGFVILKIVRKIEPQPLSFEDAKTMVENDYVTTERQVKLALSSQELLENFKGKNIGYVSLAKTKQIEGLNEAETRQFLEQLFASNKALGSLQLGDKMIVYKINDVRFLSEQNTQTEMVKQRLLEFKNGDLLNNLIKSLESKYKVISFLNNQKEE